ncbi:selenocysteine-specific translation elongation factor [Mesorhizobium sp. B2-4-17]|uniref:selenocysteine-specific translation elongation factor n=1 Tax=Mesorhizobium sp. B2-4-17 TaxID=2589932 RepID=UPI001125F11D|nr:selenocysteine-specific translation elongation factor [Mesorhizobium sp. B2-4-17]TPK88804.1 selenocysteine-specific translation elongation factor [Mesorhizobium sp. B2-4-17]
MIIGTAGHIDHGKTALVKALTGVEGDRLKEEKARGITIDLGFAYLPVEGGRRLGFIDVPGHERFVHTMLAGATGIDFAMLVVAADDGIMPQTREHLAIIDLLGIRRGIIALTKSDLATPERLAQVSAEIRAMVAETALEGADVLPVSAVTGQGVEHLRGRLAAAGGELPRSSADQRFRLAVDRVFTLAGIGVVATGTILTGTVRVGDRVRISPFGLAARVRSLHVQNEPAESGRAGDRCALNLQGEEISKEAVHRGDMVLDPELHAPTDRIDARLKLLPSESKGLRQWFPVRLHHASAEVGAHVVLLGEAALDPGMGADVQLVLDRPIAAAALDRFVIRDTSAQRTIGGGQFLDLRPPARRRRTPERAALRAALSLSDPRQAFAALLETSPYFQDVGGFASDRALAPGERESLPAAVDAIVLPVEADRIAVSRSRWHAYTSALLNALATFHAQYPDLQGIGREKLRLLLQPRLPAAVFAAALQKVARDHAIALDGAFVRLATHTVRLTPKDEALWHGVESLLGGAAQYRPPRVRDIAVLTGQGERDIRRLLKLVGRLGFVDEVAIDHFFLRSTVRQMVAIAADLAGPSGNGAFTAAQFRDRLDNGRKVAIQILEFFDRHGVTLSRGDQRRTNRHRLDLFGPLTPQPRRDRSDPGRESSPVGRSDFKSE